MLLYLLHPKRGPLYLVLEVNHLYVGARIRGSLTIRPRPVGSLLLYSGYVDMESR